MVSNLFYDSLSEFYDSMTEFDGRFEKERPFFKKIIEDCGFTSALDVGCGTGFHSILLAQSGLSVTGIDPSTKMIDVASNNAMRKGVNAQFINTNIEDFYNQNKPYKTKFDSIFCMGNTLPHFSTIKKLERVISLFKDLLRNNGLLVCQILNYQKILNEKERIISIKEVDDVTFIRFYDFHRTMVTFNILTIIKRKNKFEHNIISTFLYPFRLNEILDIGAKNHFKIQGIFGGINFEEFNANKSGNLILVLKK